MSIPFLLFSCLFKASSGHKMLKAKEAAIYHIQWQRMRSVFRSLIFFMKIFSPSNEMARYCPPPPQTRGRSSDLWLSIFALIFFLVDHWLLIVSFHSSNIQYMHLHSPHTKQRKRFQEVWRANFSLAKEWMWFNWFYLDILLYLTQFLFPWTSIRRLMWKKKLDSSFVGFMKDGAQWLVDNTDIKLVG